MVKKFLLLATILALPSLSFGQTVCTVTGASSPTLVLNGSVSLLEGGAELATLTCPGVTFVGGLVQHFTFTDDANNISDIITVTNNFPSGGAATVTFQSGVCGTGCVENAETPDTPSSITVTTASGTVLTFTSEDDPAAGCRDVVS